MTPTRRAIAPALGIILIAVTATGCVVIASSDPSDQTTYGQKLLDLKRDLDRRVITTAEYENAKAALLKRLSPKRSASPRSTRQKPSKV